MLIWRDLQPATVEVPAAVPVDVVDGTLDRNYLDHHWNHHGNLGLVDLSQTTQSVCCVILTKLCYFYYYSMLHICE